MSKITLLSTAGAVALAGALTAFGPGLVAQAATPMPAVNSQISAPADYVGPGDGCAAGTWTAKNDPVCQAMLNPGQALDNAKKAAGDVMQTTKDVCTAWEGQANVEWNQKFDNCKNLPGK
jgi:hypothetical protein